MACRSLDIELREDDSVHLTMRCENAQEAAALFKSISEKANKGVFVLKFDVDSVTAESKAPID